MKERFEGDRGRQILVELLASQKLAGGNTALAEEIALVGELIDVKAGTPIISQGGIDNDVYLILLGLFIVDVNGTQVAQRGPNDHVGEMAAIQPAQKRSSTVIAAEDSVVCKLTEAQITDLGERYPGMWRYIARELARRLIQRNALVSGRRDRVRVFIISSVEALQIARTIQNALEHDPFTVVVWTDGVFRATNYPIESLECEVDQSDIAIAVVQPDDLTESRGTTRPSPRDNVIFEMGFFMGRLGRHRAVLVEPRGVDSRLPSDLAGLTTVPYTYGDAKDLAAILGPACNRIRQIISEVGPNARWERGWR